MYQTIEIRLRGGKRLRGAMAHTDLVQDTFPDFSGWISFWIKEDRGLGAPWAEHQLRGSEIIMYKLIGSIDKKELIGKDE